MCQCVLRNISIRKMFLKWIIFVISFYSFGVVQALNEQNVTHKKLIARQYMFTNDVIELSIVNLQIDSQLPPPLMMISVMMDKTLGYNFSPFFPYLKIKFPVLDLNATANNQHFILSPSTVVFEIDFTNETLVPFSSSSSAEDDRIFRKQTYMKLISFKNDGILFYNLSFFLSIDSDESSGLYTLYFHSNSKQDVPMNFNVEVVSKQRNFNIIWNIVLLGAYCLATFALKIHYIIKHRCSLAVEYIIWMMYPIANLVLFWALSLLDFGNNRPLIVSEYENVLELKIAGFGSLIVFALTLIGYGFWRVTFENSNFNLKFTKMFHLLLSLIMTIHFTIDCFTIELVEFLKCPASLWLLFLLVVHNMTVTAILEIQWQNFLEAKYFRTIFWHLYYNGLAIFFVSSRIILATMVFLAVPFYLFWIEVIIKDILCFMIWGVLTSIRAQCLVYICNPPGNMVAAA